MRLLRKVKLKLRVIAVRGAVEYVSTFLYQIWDWTYLLTLCRDLLRNTIAFEK